MEALSVCAQSVQVAIRTVNRNSSIITQIKVREMNTSIKIAAVRQLPSRC